MINPLLRKKLYSILKNKTVLITGGTGSFGKTITKELIKFKPKEIRIFSRTEDKQVSMIRQYNSQKNLRFILGDVRDFNQLKRAMVGVDYVFHAAAQKQVPHSEYNVIEAVKTNILGAQNVIDACLENNIKKAIAISTDKAVEPVNTMGMTKALQEKLFVQANLSNGGKTVFSCVRYGNVLGSTGSVLPLFLAQMKSRQAITLTHKDMTRFILTLDEAMELVLTAFIESAGGEIFIPNIPSHSVIDLAKALLDVFNEKELRIIETGIRVGEKIHETLISSTESLRSIKKDGYYIILPEIKIDKINNKYKRAKKTSLFRYSSENNKKLSTEELKKLLLKLEFVNN